MTSSHRVVVIEGGIRTERKAGELKTGDVVLCGTRRQKLTKVIPSERETEAGLKYGQLFCLLLVYTFVIK